MTDRELLELAAKAAGLQLWTHEDSGLYLPDPMRRWNPLTDDGDALRLAVKLGICIEFGDCADNAPVVYAGLAYERSDWPMLACFPDPCKETRRAIVRAAAAIGKVIP